MSFENYSERPVGYSGSEKPIGHDIRVGEFYERQYAAMSATPARASAGSRSITNTKSSSKGWTFSWLFAFIGAFIAFAVATNNHAPNPAGAAVVIGLVTGALHQLIKFLFVLAVVGFIVLAIIKAMNG